jgi:hypothetical protein
MAKVRVQVAGGSVQIREAATVGCLAKLVGADGYTAVVNGEPAGYETALEDGEAEGDTFVSFAKPVKAG